MKHYLRVFLILCAVLVGITALSGCDPEEPLGDTTTAPPVTTAPGTTTAATTTTAPATTAPPVTTAPPAEPIPEGLTFAPVGTAAYKVSGYTGNPTKLEIPATYLGKPVVEIGESAFYRCAALTSITVPDSVTSIGESAFFWCDALTSVTLGNGVTSIGERAFSYCESLTSIAISDNVTSIGKSAFDGCTVLTIYTSVQAKLEGWASDWNDGECPVVWDCLNNDVADDGYIYLSVDGIRYGIKDNTATVMRQPTAITIAEIPSSISYKGSAHPVTAIGERAFYDCESLASVVIPDSVLSIGDEAFYRCELLTSIAIPDSVTSIGTCAFYRCGLASATFAVTEGWQAYGTDIPSATLASSAAADCLKDGAPLTRK